MPLIRSASRQAVSQNIETEMAAGKPRDQAVAIALSEARRAKGKPSPEKKARIMQKARTMIRPD